MKILKVITLGVVLGSLVACQTTGTNDTSSAEPKKEVSKSAKKVTDGSNAAPGSKFSQIKLEMSAQQVIDIIGRPNDTKTYQTGKGWNPFYYGSDAHRQEFLYKNEGRLTIGGNRRLIAITVDTTEDGYR